MKNYAKTQTAGFIKISLIAGILAAFAIVGTLAVISVGAAGNSGSIKTTTTTCGQDPVNENHYPAGEDLYVHGEGFDANTTYSWEISKTGNDPFSTDGTVDSDSDGDFCFLVSAPIPPGGPYQTKVGTKGDNFSIDDCPEDEYYNENAGQCQEATPVCGDADALNYGGENGEVDQDEVIDNQLCEYREVKDPTPTPGGDGPNVGDSNDPDNPAGTPTPQVAGVTTKVTPTPTPVPLVAGATDEFKAPATGMSTLPLALSLVSGMATAVIQKKRNS